MAQESDGSLEVHGLTRRFGAKVAVDALSFRVGAGDILGFLGPNGAGKTTTFSMLSGLLEPDSGEVRLDGQVLPLTSRALRARMGVIFQHASVDVKLTARENLVLGGMLYGLSGAELTARVAYGLELVELTDRADDPVDTFSGGMRRRLELARVLLHRPDVLLLDEPTQGLDVAGARRIWSALLELRRRESLTILVTTHSAEEAERCDRILVLDRGKTIAEGTPDALRARIGGDVVTVTGDDLDELAREISRQFEVEARVVEESVAFESPRAHELVPRLVEAFPRGRLRSVGTRAASLADVFLRLTGQTIDAADRAAEAPVKGLQKTVEARA